tara:strand:+ start:572 stop:1009 length:438 start_codon:yes stop_codon:yes gene_type:complete
MKDITDKNITKRRAVAQAVLHAKPATITMLRNGQLPKGDPLPVAKVAAIQAAKNTSQIIPYCHPLHLEHIGVEFDVQDNHITARVEVTAFYKTGVEMEALTAVSAAVLTIYDMTKGVDPSMRITDHYLISKTGGKSDYQVQTASI